MADPCARSRCRERYIEAVGDVVLVPRHITRIDSRRACGWQVRFEVPSAFFNDEHHGGPLGALRAAKRHLRAVWRPVPWQTCRKPRGGVSVVRNRRGQWYAVAHHPHRGCRRFYIGTDESRTRRREVEAKRLARAQRAEWLEAVEVPTR